MHCLKICPLWLSIDVLSHSPPPFCCIVSPALSVYYKCDCLAERPGWCVFCCTHSHLKTRTTCTWMYWRRMNHTDLLLTASSLPTSLFMLVLYVVAVQLAVQKEEPLLSLIYNSNWCHRSYMLLQTRNSHQPCHAPHLSHQSAMSS